MRRTRLIGMAVLALAVGACQDDAPLLSPDADLDPAYSAQLQADRVVPGRILARLQPGADPASVGAAHGVAFERAAAGNAARTCGVTEATVRHG